MWSKTFEYVCCICYQFLNEDWNGPEKNVYMMVLKQKLEHLKDALDDVNVVDVLCR